MNLREDFKAKTYALWTHKNTAGNYFTRDALLFASLQDAMQEAQAAIATDTNVRVADVYIMAFENYDIAWYTGITFDRSGHAHSDDPDAQKEIECTREVYHEKRF